MNRRESRRKILNRYIWFRWLRKISGTVSFLEVVAGLAPGNREIDKICQVEPAFLLLACSGKMVVLLGQQTYSEKLANCHDYRNIYLAFVIISRRVSSAPYALDRVPRSRYLDDHRSMFLPFPFFVRSRKTWRKKTVIHLQFTATSSIKFVRMRRVKNYAKKNSAVIAHPLFYYRTLQVFRTAVKQTYAS